jgi:hypothetical protein
VATHGHQTSIETKSKRCFRHRKYEEGDDNNDDCQGRGGSLYTRDEGGAHAGSPKSEHSPFMDINGRQS